MDEIELTERQQSIIRKLVEADARSPGNTMLWNCRGNAGEIHIQGLPSVFATLVEVETLAEARLLRVSRCDGPGGTAALLIVTPAAHRAVTSNFAAKPNTSIGPTVVVQNHFSGPIGAVQQGDSNTANVTQTIGATIADVLALLSVARGQLAELPQEYRGETAEHLDDIETELKGSQPKMSRIKAACVALASVTGQAASFTATVLTIMEKLGISTADVLKRLHP